MREYRICKGCHYSNYIPWIRMMRDGITMSHSVVFDESCMYDIAEKSCVNKLFGCSFGLFNVHKFSARFGWACHDGNIDIYSYVYSHGKLFKRVIKTVGVKELHEYTIHVNKDFNGKLTIGFFIDGEFLERIEVEDVKNIFCFGLGPYFGGNSRAPHKMKMVFYGKYPWIE